MKSYWLTHKGKNVLAIMVNQSNASDLRDELAALEKEVGQQPQHSVLCLNDVRNVIITPQWIELVQGSGKRIAPRLQRMAVLGVKGEIRRKLFDLMMNFIPNAAPTHTFDDRESALDWLVS